MKKFKGLAYSFSMGIENPDMTKAVELFKLLISEMKKETAARAQRFFAQHVRLRDRFISAADSETERSTKITSNLSSVTRSAACSGLFMALT